MMKIRPLKQIRQIGRLDRLKPVSRKRTAATHAAVLTIDESDFDEWQDKTPVKTRLPTKLRPKAHRPFNMRRPPASDADVSNGLLVHEIEDLQRRSAERVANEYPIIRDAWHIAKKIMNESEEWQSFCAHPKWKTYSTRIQPSVKDISRPLKSIFRFILGNSDADNKYASKLSCFLDHWFNEDISGDDVVKRIKGHGSIEKTVVAVRDEIRPTVVKAPKDKLEKIYVSEEDFKLLISFSAGGFLPKEYIFRLSRRGGDSRAKLLASLEIRPVRVVAPQKTIAQRKNSWNKMSSSHRAKKPLSKIPRPPRLI